MPRDARDTRERMLEVAETQFAQKGYEGAHLESIAAEVGVRKTALYYYFDSKAALYVAVLERMLSVFTETVISVTSGDLPTEKKLERLSDDLNALLAGHPNYSQIAIRIFVDRIPIDTRTIDPLIGDLLSAVFTFFRAGVDEGVFQKLSARHFFQSVVGMAIFHYAGGPFSAAVLDVDDIFGPDAVEWRRDQYFRLVSHGVLARRDSDPS